MRILIDLLPSTNGYIDAEAARFIIDCHKYLAAKKNDEEWFFIIEKKFTGNLNLEGIPENRIYYKTMHRNWIGWTFWNNHALPVLVKKAGADLLITTGGVASPAKIDQAVWVYNMENKDVTKNQKAYNDYCKNWFRKTIEKSKIIFTVSEKIKEDILQQNNLASNKIRVINSFADEGFLPFSWAQKESVKTKYAGGKEYFLAICNYKPEGFINLLKAFSLFKKMQQSGMQLIFCMNQQKENADFLEKFETYAYRNDVHVYFDIPRQDLIKLTSSCYAMVYSAGENDPGTMLLNAFESSVPVIIPDKNNLAEAIAEGMLDADFNSPESLANRFMLIYKDENLRSQLIIKGKSKCREFDGEKSIQKLYDSILMAMNTQK